MNLRFTTKGEFKPEIRVQRFNKQNYENYEVILQPERLDNI